MTRSKRADIMTSNRNYHLRVRVRIKSASASVTGLRGSSLPDVAWRPGLPRAAQRGPDLDLGDGRFAEYKYILVST